MKRRDFLQGAIGSAMLATLPIRRSQAAEPAATKASKPKLKPSIGTEFDEKVPISEMIPLIHDAGFEQVSLGGNATHCGYNSAEGKIALEKLLQKYNLTIPWIHAPFPAGDRLFSLNEIERQESIGQCVTAIKAARDLDGKVVVLHLIQPYDIPHDEKRQRMIWQGIESLKVLVNVASDCNVKLALENGQRKDYDQVLEACLTLFSTEPVGFCYDSGHEHVQGTGFHLLEKYGSRLLVLHLHDNDGKEDRHQLPFEGTIDWAKFGERLSRLDYAGSFSLEAMTWQSKIKNPANFLAEAKTRVDRLLESLTD